jgi:hypothetical protein
MPAKTRKPATPLNRLLCAVKDPLVRRWLSKLLRRGEAAQATAEKRGR